MSAWEAFSVTDVAIALAALAGILFGIVALVRLSVSLPVAGSAITVLFAVIALAMIVFRAIDPPAGLERDLGLWLGLAATAAILAGGYLGMQDPTEREG